MKLMQIYQELFESKYTVYHGGDVKNDVDTRHGDFGMHFGNQDQATDRLKTSPSGHVHKYEIELHNPIVLHFDMGWWNDLGRWKELTYLPMDYNGDVIDGLKRQGYDGVIYPNDVEGEGTSYIVFDKKNIRMRK